MKKHIHKTIAGLAFLAVAGLAFNSFADDTTKHGTSADAQSMNSTSAGIAKSGAQKYVTIDFEKNQSGLSSRAKQEIRDLVAASGSPKIDEVVVMAWADQEYPEQGTKAPKSEVKLADQRADAVENFIEDSLKVKADVDTHNMAERPNAWSKMFKTQDYDVKKSMETSGAAPVEEPTFTGGKASKALVMVKYDL